MSFFRFFVEGFFWGCIFKVWCVSFSIGFFFGVEGFFIYGREYFRSFCFLLFKEGFVGVVYFLFFGVGDVRVFGCFMVGWLLNLW